MASGATRSRRTGTKVSRSATDPRRSQRPRRTARLAAVAALCVGAAAHAGSGGYLAFGVGAGYATDERVEGLAGVDGDLDFDLIRQNPLVRAGWAFAGPWRVELEAAYRRNDLEILEFTDGVDVETGRPDAVAGPSLMANLVVDLNEGGTIRPYAGIGIGATRLAYEISQARSDQEILDDSATSIAYQALVGFGVDVTRRLDLTLEYGYWRAPSLDLEDLAGNAVAADHTVHGLTLGVRYLFRPETERPRRTSIPRPRGFYLAFAAGPGFADDSEIKVNPANFDAFDIGTVVSVAAGYALGKGYSVELEATHTDNDVEIYDFGKLIGEGRADGGVEAYGFTANARYEFRRDLAARPYVSLGIGWAHVAYDVSVANEVIVDDASWDLALQGKVGLVADLGARTRFNAEIRFWGTPMTRLEDPNGIDVKTSHVVQAVTLGLSYAIE